MKIAFQRLLLLIFRPFMGKRNFQNLFELIYLFSLAGMNYGVVTPKRSGEEFLLQHIRDKFSKSKRLTVFDVGANLGEYSECIINILGKKVSLFSFEPLKEAHSILKSKFKNHENVFLSNVALSDKRGKATIYFDEESSPLASLYKRQNLGMTLPVKLIKSEKIKLSTIDSFCARKKISKIDLLKIDAEGHEIHVLKGAKKMIENSKIGYIQFEFGGPMIDSGTFFRDIYYYLEPKYRIYRILQDGFIEIKKYREKHEVFLMSNYLAVSKSLKN